MASETGSEIVLGHKLPGVGVLSPDGPSRIIYRLVDYVVDAQSGFINIIYVNGNQQPLDREINAFIDEIRAEPLIGSESSTRPISPLDVNCKEDCYIVFQLMRTKNWQFGVGGDCFTTKENEGDKYSGLFHVMDDGERIPGGVPIKEGCHILFLRAKCDEVPYGDGFNLSVDLILPDYIDPDSGQPQPQRTRLIIDPDIRHPGGSGGGRLHAVQPDLAEA